MQKLTIYVFISLAIFFTSCSKNSTTTAWEDTKSLGRYLTKKSTSFWRKNVDSKLIHNQEEFIQPSEEEFISLKSNDLEMQQKSLTTTQPRQTPGNAKSCIPNIDGFFSPNDFLSDIFKNINFNTDEYVLRKKDDYILIDKIVGHLKNHKTTFVFIEGHCDERGSESYNLALGTKRSNFIRNLLIQRGADKEQLYTISYGKEKPTDQGHSRESWEKNRRVEFKIFEKN